MPPRLACLVISAVVCAAAWDALRSGLRAAPTLCKRAIFKSRPHTL